jgi:hypothetical protein
MIARIADHDACEVGLGREPDDAVEGPVSGLVPGHLQPPPRLAASRLSPVAVGIMSWECYDPANPARLATSSEPST